MSSEERETAEPCAGAFNGCLVEGDLEKNARERKIKRCAIAISVALQTAGLAVLVIAPLLAKPAELTERVAVPIPPYSHRPAATRNVDQHPDRPMRPHCVYCAPIPPTVSSFSRGDTREEGASALIDLGATTPEDSTGPISMIDVRPQPRQPEVTPHEKRRIHETQIDPALLVRRVEPVYPTLAHQIRRSGKVELHAVIATDGSVQSLEVVSGDPLFVGSALDAVRQWRYRPTYLNGQPVEIDTYITVIYTLR
jgi:periplasmic protein TonB